MEPQNSCIEVLDQNEQLKIEDINTSMDCFFVIKGAIEFTMREDTLQHARE